MKFPATTVFEQKKLAPVAAFSSAELATLKTMLAKKLNSPVTTSMGRLFDAVASLINLRQQIRFEGQAAMELEFALDGVETDEAYELQLVESALQGSAGVPPAISLRDADRNKIPASMQAGRLRYLYTFSTGRR